MIVPNAWTGQDVLDAYRRHRVTLELRVRACATADCSDEPPFSDPFQDAPDALSLPEWPLAAVQGRYFQYEVTMASEELGLTPELAGVALAWRAIDDVDVIDTGTRLEDDGQAAPRGWFCATGAGGQGGSALVVWLAVLIPARRRP
ncbi:MAG: hypothetical protein KTR31_18030 [Myxococcales bacterium]|nr:hypothetical protein [Myxococcales bacterium]